MVRPSPGHNIRNKRARIVYDTVIITYDLHRRRGVGSITTVVLSAIVVEIPKNVMQIVAENSICFNYDCECNYDYQEYIVD
ncbi:MAG: hypothetical protein FWC79_08375 [Oscillospiraceae bacterium]|nr:hypothetical protein [Oscillospiraceae bacterium]